MKVRYRIQYRKLEYDLDGNVIPGIYRCTLYNSITGECLARGFSENNRKEAVDNAIRSAKDNQLLPDEGEIDL